MTRKEQEEEQEKVEIARRRAKDAIADAKKSAAAPPSANADDKVEVASVDSMDASDPPSFTPTRAGASRHEDE